MRVIILLTLNQTQMKKIFLLTTLFASLFFSKSYSQDSTQQNQLSQLLSKYYNIKDALVAGDGNTASNEAKEFIKTANSIDYKLVTEGNINTLLKNATHISETTDVNKQRQFFAALSNNMAILSKAVKLGPGPIYQAYCPMKKASWLTNDKAIKNPYYGSAMLTCGEIKETIQK